MKNIFKIIIILIIGAIGGSLFQVLILPCLMGLPWKRQLKKLKMQ